MDPGFFGQWQREAAPRRATWAPDWSAPAATGNDLVSFTNNERASLVRSSPTPVQPLSRSSSAARLGARRSLAESLDIAHDAPSSSPPKYSVSPIRRTQSFMDLSRPKLLEDSSAVGSSASTVGVSAPSSQPVRPKSQLFNSTPTSSLKRKFESFSLDSGGSDHDSPSLPVRVFPAQPVKAFVPSFQLGQNFGGYEDSSSSVPDEPSSAKALPTVPNEQHPECPTITFETVRFPRLLLAHLPPYISTILKINAFDEFCGIVAAYLCLQTPSLVCLCIVIFSCARCLLAITAT